MYKFVFSQLSWSHLVSQRAHDIGSEQAILGYPCGGAEAETAGFTFFSLLADPA